MNERGLTIRESIHGNFFYHIAEDGIPLCGNANSMITKIPLSCWGMRTDLHEKYCPECDKIFKERISSEEMTAKELVNLLPTEKRKEVLNMIKEAYQDLCCGGGPSLEIDAQYELGKQIVKETLE